MIHHAIPHEFRMLNFVQNAKEAEELAKETPINKVPVLIDGDQKIFDSRVIVNYLTKKHDLRSLSVDEENIVSAIYGALDAGVILFLMREEGFDINGDGFFLSRQRARIPNGLEYVASWAQTLDPTKREDWNYPSMALYSFLYWAQARRLLDLKEYPRFATFVDRFKNAPGVAITGF